MLGDLIRRAIFSAISAGPIPDHIAFIMDGNRRYSAKRHLTQGGGHDAGFSSLQNMLRCCFELGVKYVTAYAFSIDNFRRSPEEVESVMHLMQRKMNDLMEKKSILNEYGVRVRIVGNLDLLTPSVRETAKLIMAETEGNTSALLSICVAYTSTDEITHAIQVSCVETETETEREMETERAIVKLGLRDIEMGMYMAVAPDPDIIIRTSGETRLSNFLLWQSSGCLLCFPSVLWPEIGLRHLVWAVIGFQRNHTYLMKKKAQLVHVSSGFLF